MQVRLAVPYAEKEKVKALGARFDMVGKFWYVPFGVDVNQFRRWLSKDLARWTVKGKIK